MTPATALVPNPTPASTQSHAADTISTSLLKSVPGAVGAGNEGPTRGPSPVPAHSLKTAGPRSTPSPSSPSAAAFDPQTPKNSLDPQESQVAKADSWLEALHAPETSKTASESRTSSKTAKKTRIQDHSHDGTEIPNLLNFFRYSRVSSSENSDIKSRSTPNHVTPTSLPTHGENHEAGASLPFPSTTLGARPSQNHVPSNSSTLTSHGSSMHSDPFDSASFMTFKQPSDTALDPLPPLSVPSSGLRSSLTDPNTWSNSQNKTSANNQAAFRNQTAFASKSKSPSTAGGPVRASSPSISTVLPYKSGNEKSVSFHPMRNLISFASVYFAFFLWKSMGCTITYV